MALTVETPLQVACSRARNFGIGSLSGSIGMVIFAPTDTIKTRMQIAAGSGTGVKQLVKEMVRNEGVLALYSGLSASVGRQVVYGGARMGCFDIFQDMLRDSRSSKAVPFWKNSLAGLASGAFAACIANPMDVSLIRMQADATLPVAAQRGYRHVGDAVSTILRNEGAAGLFSGVGPTVVRAMASNFGSLTFNAEAKKGLEHVGIGGNPQILLAGVVGGLASSFFGMPFDFVKTQMQKQTPDVKTGELPYRSALSCVQITLKQGGMLRFYAGFPVYVVRIAPFQAVTLILRDKLKQFL